MNENSFLLFYYVYPLIHPKNFVVFNILGANFVPFKSDYRPKNQPQIGHKNDKDNSVFKLFFCLWEILTEVFVWKEGWKLNHIFNLH